MDHTPICLAELERALEDQFVDKWRILTSRKPKLRTYCTFKTTFETEPYVTFYHNRKERSLLAQLRLGILPIHSETGRYRNVPVSERLCFNCENVIEDEEHFLLECVLYENPRHILFDTVMTALPTFDILSKEEKISILIKEYWKANSKFIAAAWDIRQNILYNR